MRNILAFYVSKHTHRKQKRKYTGVSYHTHCVEVAKIVKANGGTNVEIQAAYLHDALEDTTLPKWFIRLLFGKKVLKLVNELSEITTLSDGNRKVRKQIELERMYNNSQSTKFIKLADLISNTKNIREYDPRFYHTAYREECIELSKACRSANEDLFKLLAIQLDLDY